MSWCAAYGCHKRPYETHNGERDDKGDFQIMTSAHAQRGFHGNSMSHDARSRRKTVLLLLLLFIYLKLTNMLKR